MGDWGSVCVWDAAQMTTEGGPDGWARRASWEGHPGRGAPRGRSGRGTTPWGGTLAGHLGSHSPCQQKMTDGPPPDLLPPLQAAPTLQCTIVRGHTGCGGWAPSLGPAWPLSAPSPGCMQSGLNAYRGELCDWFSICSHRLVCPRVPPAHPAGLSPLSPPTGWL